MGVLKDIYSAYSNGNLCVKPVPASETDEAEIDEFIVRMGFSAAQKEDFEDILSKQCAACEENGFLAGFKAAVLLMTDVSSIGLTR